MSEDRLEGIKHRIVITCIAGKYADCLSIEDKYWLISELEECRAQKKELMDSVRRLLNEGTDGLRYYIPARKVALKLLVEMELKDEFGG